MILLVSILDPLGNPDKGFHFMSSSHWNHLLGSILSYGFSNTTEAALVTDFFVLLYFFVTGESYYRVLEFATGTPFLSFLRAASCTVIHISVSPHAKNRCDTVGGNASSPLLMLPSMKRGVGLCNSWPHRDPVDMDLTDW